MALLRVSYSIRNSYVRTDFVITYEGEKICFVYENKNKFTLVNIFRDKNFSCLMMEAPQAKILRKFKKILKIKIKIFILKT